MIDGQKIFDQLVKNDQITYDNIKKVTTGRRDHYATGFPPDYVSKIIKNYYTMIPIDLSKQQALYADPKAIQQINITGNLNRLAQTIFLIIEEAKQAILDFSQGTVKVL